MTAVIGALKPRPRAFLDVVAIAAALGVLVLIVELAYDDRGEPFAGEKAAAVAHPDKHLQLWFRDEARVGNKGRVCHRWWLKGRRAAGLCQRGYQWAYIYIYSARPRGRGGRAATARHRRRCGIATCGPRR